MGTVTKPQSPRRRRAGVADSVVPYLLISPTVLLTCLIMVMPVGYVFYLSTQDFSYNRADGGFVGLDNFVRMFTQDEVFLSSLGVTLQWVLWQVGLQLLIGLGVALLLNQPMIARSLVRALAFVPWAVSGVLTTMLWMLMLNETIGIVNALLKFMGLIEVNVAWLANPSTAFASVVVAELWRGIPFFAITLLASLQSISPSLYEASAVDGAGPVRRLTSITLPMLKETIVLTTLLRAIWEFNSVDLIYTMTGGGPIHTTTTLSVYLMETAILRSDYGYGSALGVFCFVSLLVFAVVYLRLTRYGQSSDLA